VPSVQRLAVYTGEALDELERVYLGRGKTAARAPKKSARKRAPVRKTATKRRAAK
jgi:hypothetical protein